MLCQHLCQYPSFVGHFRGHEVLYTWVFIMSKTFFAVYSECIGVCNSTEQCCIGTGNSSLLRQCYTSYRKKTIRKALSKVCQNSDMP